MKSAANMNAQKQHPKQRKPHKAPWLRAHQFAKGQSGNPGGRPHGESVTSALKLLLSRGATARECAQAIIDGVVIKKDPSFARLLLDRTDGLLTERLQAEINANVTGPAMVCPTQVVINIPSNGRQDTWDELQAKDNAIAPTAPVPALPPVPPSDTALTGNPALKPEHKPVNVVTSSPPTEPKPELSWAELERMRALSAFGRLDQENAQTVERLRKEGRLGEMHNTLKPYVPLGG